nr:pescadillo homolog [Tanacetum cinerariifolium]
MNLGDLSIDAYFREIKSIATILSSLGSPVSNDDVVNIAFDKLPKKYQHVSNNIIHRDTYPDLKTVCSMLTTAEMRLKSRAQVTYVNSSFIGKGFPRKLCIFKGFFPRDPKKKLRGNCHTYYYMKDIAFLKYKPFLEKFCEICSYDKKVKKAMSKKNMDLAERLLIRKPTYTLDMLIPERMDEVDGQKVTWSTPHAL